MILYIFIVLYIALLIISFDIKGLNPQNSKKAKKNFVVLEIIFILVAGFSYRMGSDGIFYTDLFDYYPTFQSLSIKDIFSLKYEPLWAFVNVLTRSTFNDFAIIKFLCAFSIYISAFELLKKECKHPFSALLFFYLSSWINVSFEMLRQTMAMAFIIWSCMALLVGDRKKYILRSLPACFFHWSSIVIIFLIFLFSYIKVNRLSIVLCASTFFVGLFMQALFGDLMNAINLLSTQMGERYSNYLDSEAHGFVKLNFNGFFIPILTNTILPAIVLFYNKNNGGNKYLGSILLVYLIFSSLSSSFGIANRLAEALHFFFFLATADLLFESYKRRRLVIAGTTSILLAVFLIIWTSQYITGKNEVFRYNNKDVRYFPYTSILNKKTIPEREESCSRSVYNIFR